MELENNLPPLKVDHIIYLQDARFASAAGVTYLTFCLERGNIHKIPNNNVWEMLEWLSGPQFVLDFGADYGAANDYILNPVNEDVFLQVACHADDLETAEIPPAHILQLQIDKPADCLKLLEQMQKYKEEEYIIEIAPQAEHPDWAAAFKEIGDTWGEFWIQTDTLTRISAHRYTALQAHLSVRKWIEQDAFYLDYDKFEELATELSS